MSSIGMSKEDITIMPENTGEAVTSRVAEMGAPVRRHPRCGMQ